MACRCKCIRSGAGLVSFVFFSSGAYVGFGLRRDIIAWVGISAMDIALILVSWSHRSNRDWMDV